MGPRRIGFYMTNGQGVVPWCYRRGLFVPRIRRSWRRTHAPGHRAARGHRGEGLARGAASAGGDRPVGWRARPGRSPLRRCRRRGAGHRSTRRAVTGVRTWLLTNAEADGFFLQGVPHPPQAKLPLRYAYRGPFWVVAVTVQHSELAESGGRSGYYISQYEADNGIGAYSSTALAGTTPLPGRYLQLVDHSHDQPCPSAK